MITEGNSAVVDLAVFNAKATIVAALQYVKNAEQTLHMSESSTQGLARRLHKARHSLEEWWQATQTVSFTNTDIKHATIAMADIRARTVHAGLRTLSICTLRVQALQIGTGTHSQGLATFTKDIPISSTSLFGGDLSKAVAKAATTFCNYKVHGDHFVLSGLSRPKPPKGRQ